MTEKDMIMIILKRINQSIYYKTNDYIEFENPYYGENIGIEFNNRGEITKIYS